MVLIAPLLVAGSACDDGARPIAEAHAAPAMPLFHLAIGADDASDWLDPLAGAPGTATLTVLEAECRDNGEDEACPHGPFGSVYVDFFPASQPHWPEGELVEGHRERCLPRPDAPGRCHRRLRGPHTEPSPCPLMPPARGEWLDRESVAYRWLEHDDVGPGLFAWPSGATQVVMRIWESDPGARAGRRHDVLGAELIDRAATEAPGGAWIEFHKYTGDSPRRPTDDVTFRLRLRTVVAGGAK